jgi:hypothetical protein
VVLYRSRGADAFGKTDKNMKNNILIAVPFGLSAVAATLLSFYSEVTVESVIGWASVGALLAVAMLDYRVVSRRSGQHT